MKKYVFIAVIMAGYLFAMASLFYGCYKQKQNIEQTIASEESRARMMVEDAGGAGLVLKACRELYAEINPQKGKHYNHFISLTNNAVPLVIRKLPLRSIVVDKEQILLDTYLPYRVALLAFPEGRDQYGTSMITNGLWFWNGDLSEDSKEVFERLYPIPDIDLDKLKKKE